jgi:hypothetical protein
MLKWVDFKRYQYSIKHQIMTMYQQKFYLIYIYLITKFQQEPHDTIIHMIS